MGGETPTRCCVFSTCATGLPLSMWMPASRHVCASSGYSSTSRQRRFEKSTRSTGPCDRRPANQQFEGPPGRFSREPACKIQPEPTVTGQRTRQQWVAHRHCILHPTPRNGAPKRIAVLGHEETFSVQMRRGVEQSRCIDDRALGKLRGERTIVAGTIARRKDGESTQSEISTACLNFFPI